MSKRGDAYLRTLSRGVYRCLSGLSLNEQKTRVLQFGRYAASQPKNGC